MDGLFALLGTPQAGRSDAVSVHDALVRLIASSDPVSLPALAGEENTLEFMPRGDVLCAAGDADESVFQAMVASAFGNTVMLAPGEAAQAVKKVLGERCIVADGAAMQSLIDAPLPYGRPDVVLISATTRVAPGFSAACLKHRIPVIRTDAAQGCDFTSLVRERITTVNASAAGGNTQLMVLSEGEL